ncbi:GNAT family N-acetyltransferase [Streptomyces specialis]|uniref:GNAT family N-acetyltransferase n=1 Tax=Streptomyces specialis TaxID=498367 RepID=UPI00073E7F0C|nr:GNAT family N-acetyltransferase [Streptomyces specialis]
MTSQPDFALPTTVRLSGHGVVLRQWLPEDLDTMAGLFDDPEVARWTPLRSPFDEDAAREYLSNALARAAAGTRIQLAITTDGLTPLGEVVLLPGDDGRREVELGYSVGRPYRRRGLARRALTVLTDFTHRELAPARVVLRIDRDNAASNAVARATGYRLTDDEPLLREGADHRFTLLTWEHAPEPAPGPR